MPQLKYLALPNLDQPETLPRRCRFMRADDLAKYGPGIVKMTTRDALRYRENFETDTFWGGSGDVLRWKSNNAPVPMDIFRDAYVEPPTGQQAARDRDLRELFDNAREQEENMSDEAHDEMMFEMRAAFGPDEEVVNVFTGKHYRT